MISGYLSAYSRITAAEPVRGGVVRYDYLIFEVRFLAQEAVQRLTDIFFMVEHGAYYADLKFRSIRSVPLTVQYFSKSAIYSAAFLSTSGSWRSRGLGNAGGVLRLVEAACNDCCYRVRVQRRHKGSRSRPR